MTNEKVAPPSWRVLLRLALWTLLGVVLLEGGWLLFFGWAEKSGRLAAWINRRPDKVVVSFQSIASRWPGLVEIEGLVVRGRTRRLDWEVVADHAKAQMELMPLLTRRLVFRNAEVRGIEVRSRRQLEVGAELPEHAPRLHPMPAATARSGGGGPGMLAGLLPGAAALKWTFEFRHFSVAGVRQVQLDESELSGSAKGEIGFEVDTGSGMAEIFPSTLAIEGVSLRHRGGDLGRSLTGQLSLALTPYSYREERGRALVPHATGAIQLRGELDDHALLAELLRRVSWVEIEPGVAPLDADLSFRAGRLTKGSRLVAPRSGRRVRLLDFTIEGANGLSLEVGDEARWEVRFESFRLWRGDGTAPLLIGNGLALVGRTSEPDLADLAAQTRLELELGDAHLPDLGFLRAWFPAAARIEKLGGSATVKGRLGAGVADRAPSGEIDLTCEHAALRWNGLDLSGELETKVVVSGGDVMAKRLELDGTRVLLKDFAAPNLTAPGGASSAGWWMQFQLARGEVALGPPVTASGRFVLRMRDTAPILALFETRRDLPRWAEKLLSKQDVSATGAFHGGPGDLALDQLETELLGGKLSARLHFAGQVRTGKLLLAWQRLALGVGFEEGGRRLHVLQAREWYDQQP
jgi:hypothetical protein